MKVLIVILFGLALNVRAGIYEDCVPSVVIVYDVEKGSQGTGFYATPNIIVTARHCAMGNRIIVEDVTGKRQWVKGVLRSTRADVALLSVDCKGLSYLRLRKKRATIGEEIFKIGNGCGIWFSFSRGIISKVMSTKEGGLLTSDIRINHGDSGAPVLDVRGEVVGVVSSILTEGGGLSLLVPISEVWRLSR